MDRPLTAPLARLTAHALLEHHHKAALPDRAAFDPSHPDYDPAHPDRANFQNFDLQTHFADHIAVDIGVNREETLSAENLLAFLENPEYVAKFEAIAHEIVSDGGRTSLERLKNVSLTLERLHHVAEIVRRKAILSAHESKHTEIHAKHDVIAETIKATHARVLNILTRHAATAKNPEVVAAHGFAKRTAGRFPTDARGKLPVGVTAKSLPKINITSLQTAHPDSFRELKTPFPEPVNPQNLAASRQ